MIRFVPLLLTFALAVGSSAQAVSRLASTDEALRILTQVDEGLKTEPANPRLLTIRGAQLRALHRDREALQSFDKALAISPKFLLALEGAAEVAYRTRNPEAAKYLDRILLLDAANVPAHAMLGTIAFETHHCAAANQHFASSLDAVRDNPIALAEWGECLLANEQADVAVEKFRQSRALDPSDRNVAFNIALALHLSGQNVEAEREAYKLALDSGAENLLGAIYAAEDRLPEAIAAYRKATELDPTSESNYIDLASVCLDHQSFDIAEDVVNAGIANIPRSAALFTLRGAIEAQTSKVERSAADFEQASRLKPNETYGDVGLAMLLRQQEQIDPAISVIRVRLSKSPNDVTLNFLLADLLMRRSNGSETSETAEVEKLLMTAIRLDPKMGKAHSALGKLLFHSGSPDRAAQELKRALELDANDRLALNQYVLVLRLLNRNDEAAAAAERLRLSLIADRQSEVNKNRLRLVRLSSTGKP